MKNIFLKTSLFFISLTCYYFFFWEEKFGLNLFIFNALLMIFIYFDFKAENKISSLFICLMFSNLIASISVLIQNTDLSKCTYFITLMILVGFASRPNLVLIHQIFVQYLIRFFKSILQFFVPIKTLFESFMQEVVNKNRYLSKLKIALIPLVVLSVFYTIFNFANPIFQALNATFFNKIKQFFTHLPDFSFGRLLFLLGGYYILVSIFYKQKVLKETTKTPHDYIQQANEDINDARFQTGQLTILLVNILLMVINFIDIKYLWFSGTVLKNEDLSSLVHTGTYMLIFSILLSIAIILFFFKSELNFHPKIKQLRVLAYIWIFQNGILVVSVLIRNANYIEQYGLTYKRIGIMIFLFLTTIGLLTLVFKIKEVRSFFYIFKINTWAWYAALILLACIDFDAQIVQYNINNAEKTTFDLAYSSKMSVRTFLLVKNSFKKDSKDGLLIEYNFQSNILIYRKELEKYSWLSWNKADSNFKSTE